jgi:hypothetical protein
MMAVPALEPERCTLLSGVVSFTTAGRVSSMPEFARTSNGAAGSSRALPVGCP